MCFIVALKISIISSFDSRAGTLTIIDIHFILSKRFLDMIRNLRVHHSTSDKIMVAWEPPQNNDVQSYKVRKSDFQSPFL